MSSLCPNCGTKLTCGCQRRSASNGASVCSNCISSYENALIVKRNSGIPGAIPNAPTNVGIKYNQGK